MKSDALAADLIEASASGYAAAAVNVLIAGQPAIAKRYGNGAQASWKAHFVQRLMELAAALRVGAPDAFAARALWQYKAFVARKVDAEDVRASLSSLKSTLLRELPTQAQDSAASYIDHALAALSGEVALDASELDPGDPTGALTLNYLAACLEGDPRRAIELVLGAAEPAPSLESIYLDVVFPALREIGRMWHNAEVSVAEERIVSETTRRLMTLITHACTRVPDIGKTVVTAAVAGNAHDLGARGVADFFEAAGWRSLSLGPDVPPAEIANAVKFFDADLVVLATTLTTQLKSLEASIDAIRAVNAGAVKILVGGHALDESPELWRRVGADGYASAAQAVAAGSRLVGLKG